MLFAVGYAQALVQLPRIWSPCYRPAPGPGPEAHDAYLQGHAWLGAHYLDGTAQRMAVAAPLGAEVLEELALSRLLGWLQIPSRFKRTEDDRVPGIYGQSGWQLTREDAV